MFVTAWLPRRVLHSLDAAASELLNSQSLPSIDFARPLGEPALLQPHSVSWRIFKNPVALFVGGVAAVILELAHPLVRAAIWERSVFRKNPMSRLRRTGLAAMVTVYGPISVARPLIAGVVRMHANVTGRTVQGVRYDASDPHLLRWVNGTAAFGFAQAYTHYVANLTGAELDSLYADSAVTSTLYGATGSADSRDALRQLFHHMQAELSASSVIFEFLEIMCNAPALPPALRWMQPLLVRAAVDMLPNDLRLCLGLSERYGLRLGNRGLVKLAGALSDRIVLPHSPASRSCIRLGLRPDYLYGQ